MITFKKKKTQKSPEVIITLPTGETCEFSNGKFTTDSPSKIAWLKELGYSEISSKSRKRE